MIGCTYCDRAGQQGTVLAIRTTKIGRRWNYVIYAHWSSAYDAYVIQPEYRYQTTPAHLYCQEEKHPHPIPKREYVRDGSFIRASDTRRMMSLL